MPIIATMLEAQAWRQKERIEKVVKGATVKIRQNGNDFEVVVCKLGGSPTPEHSMDQIRDIDNYLARYEFKNSADEPT